MPRQAVALTAELPPGRGRIIQVGEFELVVVHLAAGWRAYRNVCPHAGAPLCPGAPGETGGICAPEDPAPMLECPWHGWRFRLVSGEHADLPGCRLQSFPVEIEGPTVYVVA